jgi:hypothetical protein
MADLAAIIEEIAQEMRDAPDRGTPASYIPPLAGVDPAHFGIAVIEADGTEHVAGDGDLPFSIQSISKVFALTLALGAVGDQLWTRVGREPSGTAFNSIVQLESEHGIPRNPFINAGAIVVADSQYRARQLYPCLRQSSPSGRTGARRLFPLLRAGDELPPARPRRTVPDGRRPRPGHGTQHRFRKPRQAHQRADAHLWAL